MRIEQLARERGVPLSWNAFLLSRMFRAQGWNDSPFNLYPVKGRYMWRDLERICEAQRLPFRRPSQFPRNGLLAARIACRFSSEAWTPAFVRAIYHANFAEDQDIADRRVIAACLRSVNQDADTVLEAVGSAETKIMLRDRPSEQWISASSGRLASLPTRNCSGEMIGWKKLWAGANAPGNERMRNLSERLTSAAHGA